MRYLLPKLWAARSSGIAFRTGVERRTAARLRRAQERGRPGGRDGDEAHVEERGGPRERTADRYGAEGASAVRHRQGGAPRPRHRVRTILRRVGDAGEARSHALAPVAVQV